MTRRHALGVTGILLLMTAGLGLLYTQARPTAERLERETAVRLALGPDGSAGLMTTSDLPGAVAGPAVSPVVVNLRDIPRSPDPGDSMLDRYLTGGLDLDGIDGPLSEAAILALQEEALALEPGDAVQPADAAETTALSPGLNFSSIDYTECCAGGGSVPPDPEIAVGPRHIVAVVNVAFEIYGKDGTSLEAPRTFRDLFLPVPGCNGADNTLTVRSGLFDPNVVYDEQEDRFIIAIDRLRSDVATGAVVGGSHYCVGVSATNNPLGNWFLYAFPMDTSNPNSVWMDYPAAGMGRDALYMGGNMFTTGGSPSYVESRVWAFRKSDLMVGLPTAPVERSVGDNFTPQPLHLHGAAQGTWPGSGPHYFLAVDDDVNGSFHRLLAWSNPFAIPTPGISVVAVLDMDSATGVDAGFPVSWPQLGGNTIRGNDWRPLDFEYRNGFGWVSATISCNPGTGTVNCVRWAQVSLSTGNIVNAGVYASNSNYRTFPDLAVNHCNDMAIGYTKGNASMYPGTFVAARQAADPAGLLQGELALKAGEITYTAFDSPPRRWGDYTGMTIDPNGQTFWYIGQYSKNTGDSNGRWGTYIGAFTMPGCDAPAPTPTPFVATDHTNLPAIIQVSTPTPTGTPTPIPDGPQPGHWQSYDAAVEFDVTADRQRVEDFFFYFRVNDPDCPDVYAAQAEADIAAMRFEFSGSFYGAGTFSTATSAAGLLGLYDYYVPGCGYVYTPEEIVWTSFPDGTYQSTGIRDSRALPVLELQP